MRTMQTFLVAVAICFGNTEAEGMEVRRSLSQKAALDWTKKFQALQKNISFYMEQEEDLASFVSSLFKMQNFELHLIVGSGVRNGTKEQNGPLEARLFEDHQVPGMSWFLKNAKLPCTLAACDFLQLFSTTLEELRHFQKSPTVKPFLQGSLEKKNNKICFFFKKKYCIRMHVQTYLRHGEQALQTVLRLDAVVVRGEGGDVQPGVDGGGLPGRRQGRLPGHGQRGGGARDGRDRSARDQGYSFWRLRHQVIFIFCYGVL